MRRGQGPSVTDQAGVFLVFGRMGALEGSQGWNSGFSRTCVCLCYRWAQAPATLLGTLPKRYLEAHIQLVPRKGEVVPGEAGVRECWTESGEGSLLGLQSCWG